MPGNAIEVVKGQVFIREKGSKPLSALAFWERREDDFTSPEGIPLTGMARPFLEVVIGVQPKLELKFQNESGSHQFTSDLVFPSDHIVIDGVWMPIYEEDMAEINKFLVSQEIKIGCIVTPKIYISLLALKNTKELQIVIPQNLTFETTSELRPISIPSLTLKPRKYQEVGIKWLCSMYDEGIGGLLGDQMGLGKTIQLIALALYSLAGGTNKKVLIVAPSSLIGNWEREFLKCSPETKVYIHAGTNRIFSTKGFDNHQIILTSYDVLIRDIDLLEPVNWDLIICDEAHRLKNPNSQGRKAIQILQCNSKILATGTPVENQLLDLWSLMDLIRPGIMGDRRTFLSLYEDEISDAAEIGNLVKPIILRRLVRDELSELPPLIEIDEPLDCDLQFAKAYESVRMGALDNGKDLPIIARIQKLRMFCCYPPLVDLGFAGMHDFKLARLLEILDGVSQSETDKVLIFTSYHDSIDYLLQVIKSEYPHAFLGAVDGRYKRLERDQIIEDFTSWEGFAVLVANPKAAGEGLNITAANHVIHFNREWNPQKENQATARARRPGQSKTVFSHRLFYLDTIEEVISERLLEKSDLADSALHASELEAGDKSIELALSISPSAKFSQYNKEETWK